tara:strand:+ start:676 stop:1494 length:819 start_codon:yes stop_codon:yes gene_type:complete
MQKIKNVIRTFFYFFGIGLIKNDFGRHQKLIYKKFPHALNLNLGSGSFSHPNWKNVDMPNDFYSTFQNKIDIEHDFTSKKELPFKNETVDNVYTSHVIEHIDDTSVDLLFSDVYRILNKGGFFRITCPDMNLVYKAYQRDDDFFWGEISPWKTNPSTKEERLLEFFATSLSESISYGENKLSSEDVFSLYQDNSMEFFFELIVNKLDKNDKKYIEGHRNWFTKEKISRMLKHAGFESIEVSAYLQSSSPLMRDSIIFDNTSPQYSLYIECHK